MKRNARTNGSLLMSILMTGKTAPAVLLAAGFLLLVGCQTFETAGIRTAIPPDLMQGPTTYRDGPVFSPLLVVLRYPAQIEPEALTRIRPAVRASYDQSEIKGDIAKLPDGEIDRAVLNHLAKTTYYVFELYQYLSRQLPPSSVLLHPIKVTVDRQGRLQGQAASTLLPTVLILDFQVSVVPIDVLRYGDQTFGHWIAPELGLTTSFQAWPSTLGTIATRGSYEPALAFDPMAGPEGAGRTSYLRDLNKHFGLDFRAPGYKERQYSGLPIKWDRLLQLPKITYHMPTEEMVAQAKSSGGPGEHPPARALHDMIGAIVVGALRETDQYLATRDAWIRYISLYDSELGQRWPRWPRSEQDSERLRLIAKFAATERRFLTDQDSETVREVYRGAFGDSMRQLFAAELETRERSVQAVNRANALAVVTMVAGGLTGDVGRSISQLAALDQQLAREASGLTSAFRNHFGRIQSQQAVYVIETSEGQTQVRGQTLAELRDAMKDAYTTTVRRVGSEGGPRATPDGNGWLRDQRTGCHVWYGSPGDDASVLLWTERDLANLDVQWSGPCRNGKADGYGLARFFKQGFYFGEVDGTFEDGRARGRATSLLTIAYDAEVSKDWRWASLIAPYSGPPREYIIYFVEAELNGTEYSGGYLQSSAKWTQYRAPGKRAMTAGEIASFEAERKKLRTFRVELIPRH
jgi:hypothetical protein